MIQPCKSKFNLASLYLAPESLRGSRVFLRSTNADFASSRVGEIPPYDRRAGLGVDSDCVVGVEGRMGESSAGAGVELVGEIEGEPPKLAGISLITGSESYVSFSLRSIW